MTLSRPKRRESSSHKYIEGKNFRNLKNDFQDKKRAIPENTHYREKYHCTSDPPLPGLTGIGLSKQGSLVFIRHKQSSWIQSY